ncbi:mitochondrial glutathione transporter SLC25A40 isoform X2 [Tiliqua scincoides]|uniref:mitochondrial glutathione transporter SLC25A40 isoform X2 n=1 Tax=Tiliqua scincoides TaxID=71010 RepID=UPI0034632558
MGSEKTENGLYKIKTSQQVISCCCGAVLTSLLGKSFLESDGLTDHICVYENENGKPWPKKLGHFTGMRDAFVKITQREGVRALWSGLPPSLLVSVPTTVIYFTCYEQLCDALTSKLGDDNDYIPLIAGATARLGAATVISPVEMIRTRMQSSRLTYKQLCAYISNNLAKDGWLSLWRGWGPTILRDVPFSALYWCNYEYFKKKLCKRAGKSEPTFLITFPSGAAAGSIAALLTLPFDVVKTHRQTEMWMSEAAHSTQQRSSSILEVMRRIVQENGFAGLYTGIVPRLAKIAPSCAIMISTYEYGKSFFRKLNKDRHMKNH